jgi:hypothetical protein
MELRPAGPTCPSTPARPDGSDLVIRGGHHSAARPDARFTGSVQIGDRTFAIADATGALYYYGGRRLLERWAWISASEFEGRPDLRLEAFVGASRLWDVVPMPLGVGYVWLTSGSRSEYILSPVNGLIRHRTDGNRIVLEGIGLRGRRHRLSATAEPTVFNDLGEGIRQTLLADLELDGVPAVAGSVGLEFRDRGASLGN